MKESRESLRGKIKISLPVEPNIKIEVKGLSESEYPTDVVIAVNLPDGRQKLIDTFPITVFDAGLAVDYNRDGTIEFDDAFTMAGNDHVPSNKPFEFWLNDDYDFQDVPDSGDEANLKFYQDDRKENLVSDPYEPQVKYDWKDYKYDKIQVERDLEDFSRFAIKKVDDIIPESSGFEYVLSLRSAGNPMIKVYRAKLAKDDYLFDAAKAEQQLNSKLVGNVITTYQKESSLTIKPEFMTESAGQFEGTGTVPFLFEGVSAGSGKLWLELYKDGVSVARYKIPMNLKPVGEFLEEYTVGDGNTAMPGDRIDLHKFNDTPEPDTDYILFVHGWNWDVWQKQRYAETTFKRLYWLGYKGRFGSFRWPCTYAVPYSLVTFDVSEYKALLSAEKLKVLIKDLKAKNYKIHLYAHSQGSMVVGEALRQMVLDPNILKPAIESLTFTQAAISASLFDPSYPEKDITPTLNYQMLVKFLGTNIEPTMFTSCLSNIVWPDLHGHYPIGLENTNLPNGTELAYFERVKEAVQEGMMFNFYNPVDYAVGNYKDTTSFNGAWMADQYIKPLRTGSLLQLFENKNLAFKYGADNLTTEQKLHFMRNEIRQDTFCWLGLGVDRCNPWVCTFEINDFSKQDERYLMIAFGGRSRSSALGGMDAEVLPSQTTSGFLPDNNINLHSKYEWSDFELYHGAQFRGSLATPNHNKQKYPIREYWKDFLENIKPKLN